MKRRKLLQQLPAWVAAPSFVRAQSGPKLLLVLTSFAKKNAADLGDAVLQIGGVRALRRNAGDQVAAMHRCLASAAST